MSAMCITALFLNLLYDHFSPNSHHSSRVYQSHECPNISFDMKSGGQSIINP